MAVTAFGPEGPNYSTSRPVGDPTLSGAVDTWMVNCSVAGAKDGTYPTADFYNVIIANLREAVRGGAIALDNTDNFMLLHAIQAIAGASATTVHNTGVVAVAPITGIGTSGSPLVAQVFTGATAILAGTSGVVPASAIGDQGKILSTTGWTAISAALSPVTSVSGRLGAIVLTVGDIFGAAPLASPAFSGSASFAGSVLFSSTTAFAGAANFAGSATLTGPVTLAGATSVTGPAAFTLSPAVPTVATADASTNAASTAFVHNLTLPLAPLASPAFTGAASFAGSATVPTMPVADSSLNAASTAFVHNVVAAAIPNASATAVGQYILSQDAFAGFVGGGGSPTTPTILGATWRCQGGANISAGVYANLWQRMS